MSSDNPGIETLRWFAYFAHTVYSEYRISAADIALATPATNNALISDLNQQLSQIKHRFADEILRSFIIIVLLGLPLSLSRALAQAG